VQGWARLTDVGQVAAPAAALIAALVGLATATSLQEVQRNHAVLFVLALGAVTLSAVLLGVAALVGKARTGLRVVASFLAVVAVVGGLGLVTWTATEPERPLIAPTAEPDPATKTVLVKADVSVDHVPSWRRLVVIVDGLTPTTTADSTTDENPGDFYKSETVYQAYVGGSSSGQIQLPVAVRVPADKYEAIGVKAYVGAQGDAAGDLATICERYPRRVSTFKERRADVGPGCTIIVLPPTSTATATPKG
jgi:hypothetical protein